MVNRCTPLSTTARRDRTEVLCDLAASELLLPARYMRNAIADATFDLDAISSIAADCDASFEAAARRFISQWPQACLLLRLEQTTKPTQPAATPRLRVTASVANGAWPYIPLHKSLSDHHPLVAALEGTDVTCVTDLDDLTKQPAGPAEIHARHCPFVDNEGRTRERILAIARPVT